ncbi:MAG: nucleotidyltransferase family protein [Pseudomonadota bacterium]|nr:nucleotidyltransferase family protein [Pseudomonadota bacterium]MDE3037067.1 nucleotidyltransferase family protein [Pseudomonadota bacterium]
MNASRMPVRAMVLAAGLGTRMRPLTDRLPKALVPVQGKTLLDRALDWLVASGVREAVVNHYHMAEMIEAHLARRAAPRLRLSRENERLETGGGIRLALPFFDGQPFFSVNSDVICIDGHIPALHRLWQTWDDSVDALLLVHPVARAVGYDGAGDFFVSPDGVIRRRQSDILAPFVFTGVQLLHPRLFGSAPPGAFSLNRLYNRGMSADGVLQHVRALVHDGDWLHVGTPENLRQAESWLSAHRLA